MKKILLAGVGILITTSAIAQEPDPIPAGIAPASIPYAPGVDVVHYEVEIGLGEGADWFEGKVAIHISVEEINPILPLDFSGLEITEVLVATRAADFRHEDGVLRIPLTGYQAGDVVTVQIAYQGVPDDGLILRDNIHGAPTAFVDNWPNRTRFWLPSVDHPSDKATVRYTVHAPSAWKVIANGHLAGEPTSTPSGALGPAGDRRSWVWEVGVPISPYNMVIGAADMEISTVGLAACGRAPASRRADGCVEVTYWVFPEDVEKAHPSFPRAAQMVEFFTDLVGDYPFEKLANVQSATRFGGMENASAIFYSEREIASGRSIEGTVSHEIAHQWFGDAVTEASWHHLWLSEGFATYFGALFFEATDGVEGFRERMEQSRQRILQSQDVNRPVVDLTERDLFALLNDNNYQKGGWVLHMLRGLLGDEVFFAGIREYYRRYLHTAVLTEDLQAVMEEISHQDLSWFFAQWIHSPGYPVLEVEEEWIPGEDGSGESVVTVQQVQKPAWPRFRLPLTLCWGEEPTQVCRDITSGSHEDTFRFRFQTRPTSPVMLDPDGWVLKGDTR